MTFPDSFFERVGAAQYPIPASEIDGGSIKDPACDVLLEFFAACINYELGGHITTVQSGSPWQGATSDTPLADTNPVVDKVPMLPTPDVLRQRKTGFPALYLDREGDAEVNEDLLDQWELQQDWSLTYLLGPLEVGSAMRLKPVLSKRVPDIIGRAVAHKRHRAYQDNALQLGVSKAGLSWLRLVKYTWGPATVDEGKPGYWGCTMTLQSGERDYALDSSFPDFEGGDIEIGVGDGEEILPAQVVVVADG